MSPELRKRTPEKVKTRKNDANRLELFELVKSNEVMLTRRGVSELIESLSSMDFEESLKSKFRSNRSADDMSGSSESHQSASNQISRVKSQFTLDSEVLKRAKLRDSDSSESDVVSETEQEEENNSNQSSLSSILLKKQKTLQVTQNIKEIKIDEESFNSEESVSGGSDDDYLADF